MTHSVGRQSGAPFVSGPGATNNVTNNFTGGPWTFIRTHVDSSAETLATWRLDEDTSAVITFGNATSSNATLIPFINLVSSGANVGGWYGTQSPTDTGVNPIGVFNARIGSGTNVVTRPMLEWRNNGTAVLSLIPLNSGANGALSWGTQTGADPAFTTRSVGTRLVLYSSVSGTKVDNAIGVSSLGTNTWYSVQEATSSYAHKFYAGQTEVVSIRGDGYIKASSNRSGFTTLGSSRMLDLADTNGSTSNRVEIGFGYQSAATYPPVVIGSQVTDGNAFTFGSWYVATRGVTTDTAPTVRVLVTGAGDVGIGKTPTTGIILDLNGQLGLKSYTVATLPSAAVQAGAIVYASDAGGNGPCLVISNGTNWKRCDNTSTTVS